MSDNYNTENESFENNLEFPQLEKSQLYKLSGGIPYYAKKIGESILNSPNIKFSSNILKSDFEQIYSNLNDVEKKIIYQVIKKKKIKEKNALYNLCDKGILADKGKGVITINGLLLEEYLEYKFESENLE